MWIGLVLLIIVIAVVAYRLRPVRQAQVSRAGAGAAEEARLRR